MTEHELRHAPITDGRWVPACKCGWWSINGSHAAFERHMRREREVDDGYNLVGNALPDIHDEWFR